MKRDRLVILKPGFEDPDYAGQTFYCWHCVLMEGLLASFPELAQAIDVERVAWPRPRREVIDWVGENNQSMPLLVLAERETSCHQTGTHKGRAFISDKDKILAALSDRYGIPVPHP